jgi:hypothetical protein
MTNANRSVSSLLSELAAISFGRDFLNTNEFAQVMVCKPQTARKNYCLTGECFGVRPLKRGRNLLWPVARTSEVLSGVGG